MWFGIVFGLTAAFFQDGGYVFSRLYMKRENNAWRLLIFTQGWMGLVSLPALLLLLWWGPGVAWEWRWLLPLCAVALGSISGQFFFFQAEKGLDPSRLASLMGLRVIFQAVLCFGLLGQRFDGWQVGGIVLAACSAGVMNYIHGHLSWRGMGWVGASLGCYAISDFSVKLAIDGLHTTGLVHAALLTACLVNILLAIGVMPWLVRLPMRGAWPVAPFAGCWLLKQGLLYTCFGLVGPVFGNVIMAARGPISIMLMLLLVPFHIDGLTEHRIPLTGWIRRAVATVMMVLAIVLYALGGQW